MYENRRGVPQEDHVEAVKWWRKAADQGNAEGIAALAGDQREERAQLTDIENSSVTETNASTAGLLIVAAIIAIYFLPTRGPSLSRPPVRLFIAASKPMTSHLTGCARPPAIDTTFGGQSSDLKKARRVEPRHIVSWTGWRSITGLGS
jgi:Sel1 repeat